MDVHYSDELKQAFIVSPDHLKKLVELLQKRIGKVNIRVGCVDNIEREFNTVKDLIAYENSKSKRICRIHLRARSDDYSKSATIVFRDHLFVRSGISIEATGREDVVSRLKEEILDVVAGMRPWYNFTFHPKVPLIIGLISGMIIGVFSGLGSDGKDISVITNLRDAVPIYLMVGIIYLLLIFLFHKPYGYLFPKVFFTIGQGEAQFKLLEKIRWVVIIGFGVSLTAGLVVSIIMIFI